jgi:galactokinase
LNELFSLNFEKWDLIKMAQLAEHHYAGTRCGIMDQFASMMGVENKAMMLDCRSLAFDYFPIFTSDFDLLLLNSGVSHSLASSEYNLRRSECEEGLHILKGIYPELNSLRDVSVHQLENAISLLPSKIFRRCRHVVSENLRVHAAALALQKNDLQGFGNLLYQSHDSLRLDYEVSCPELDFLVDFTRSLDTVQGCRMMGGGFGGCTIQLVKKESTPQFIESASQLYHERFGIFPAPIRVSIGKGAAVYDAGH